MITIKINGNEHEVEEGVRLVNAIEDLDYDISHRCGGKAKCTTCRITVFKRGAWSDSELTKAESNILYAAGNLLGTRETRLSCQMKTHRVMDGLDLEIGMPVSENEWDEAGPRPADDIEP